MRSSFIFLFLLAFEKSYVVKESEVILKHQVYNLVSYYLPIEKTNPVGNLFLETLPVVVDDIVFELKVYITFHGFNTYRVIFRYDFYKVTPNGLERTGSANKLIYNLISAIDGDFKQIFYGKIIYDY